MRIENAMNTTPPSSVKILWLFLGTNAPLWISTKTQKAKSTLMIEWASLKAYHNTCKLCSHSMNCFNGKTSWVNVSAILLIFFIYKVHFVSYLILYANHSFCYSFGSNYYTCSCWQWLLSVFSTFKDSKKTILSDC